MTTLGLATRQVQFEIRTFRRNVTGMVFTILFPVMFLVLFGIGSSDRTIDSRGGLPFVQFFVPGILAYGVVAACYNNLAMRVTILRDWGVLKRVRGTPLPSVAYLGGHIGASVVIGLGMSVLILVAGKVLYGIHVYAHLLPGVIVTLIVGSACLCAIALAVSSLVPNADSAPALVNFTIFPILFISDVFYPIDDAPRWLQTLGGVFPIKHFANALQAGFNPHTAGAGFQGRDLMIMAIWGLVAGARAVRTFRWENKSK